VRRVSLVRATGVLTYVSRFCALEDLSKSVYGVIYSVSIEVPCLCPSFIASFVPSRSTRRYVTVPTIFDGLFGVAMLGLI